jgi:hypothetical protein
VPEGCRDSGDRGTVGVHRSRTGLWGGRLGNRWLYPEADGLPCRVFFVCFGIAVGRPPLTGGVRRKTAEIFTEGKMLWRV